MCGLCNTEHPNYAHWGDYALLQRIQTCAIPLHLFGHVHDQPGTKEIAYERRYSNGATSQHRTVFSNAALPLASTATVIDVTCPM